MDRTLKVVLFAGLLSGCIALLNWGLDGPLYPGSFLRR